MKDNLAVSKRRPIKFKRNIKIHSYCAAGGTLEKDGPLGGMLDLYFDDSKMSAGSWEKQENEMCRQSLSVALSKGGITQDNLDMIFAGDLMNQCTGMSYGLSEFDVPYLGLYGACSTFAEGLLLAGVMIDSGHADCVAVCASSHFCTAERQYRFPLEYGSFSELTAQSTVTGAGAVILSATDGGDGIYLTEALPGIVCDRGIKDAANMGAAMCGAFLDTLIRYLDSEGYSNSDFDLIASGDLGAEGKKLVLEVLSSKYKDVDKIYNDCGTIIYDLENQKVGSGGSGCGCSAVTTCSYILNSMKEKKIQNCLLAGTGALMSPQSILQGNSIPSVAHLVRFETR